tara:strand:+ start:22100 stop:22711 length:612 start_codon:yes stop_codon:yes gene_type:complete
MKIMKTTTEDLHSFLILVSTVLKKESRTSMTTLRSLHNIPVVILDHLVSEGVISSNGKGRGVAWKWTGEVVASREVAELLLLQVKKGKEVRSKNRKKALVKQGKNLRDTLLSGSYDNGQKQFDAIIAGKDPFAETRENPLAVTNSKPVVSRPVYRAPQPVYEAPEPVVVEAITKEALEPLKKKSYGITKLLWGRIVLRTNYYE